MTDKNRDRLRPFSDERKAIKLRDLPLHLRRLAEANPRPKRAAMQAQIAVAIELLLFTRMRIGNLAALDIERNFRPGREDELIVVVEADHVKNREPIECPLPKRSAELLDWYFRTYRLRLTSPQNTAVFPGRDGQPKKKPWFTTQISRTIFLHVGVEFNPHLFRHFVAMIYLDRHPGGYEVVRRALAHRSIQTTTNSYSGMEGPAAIRHFHDEILGLRRGDSETTEQARRNPRERKSNGRGRP